MFGLDGKLRWEETEKAGVGASAYAEVFAIPEVPEAGSIEFIRLDLAGANGNACSSNFYWLPGNGVSDLEALQRLAPVRLESAWTAETRGSETIVRATVANPTDTLAFFIQLAVTRGARGAEVVPVLWDDNYFSLLPHESRVIAATIATCDLAGAEPALEVGGWNVQTDCECTALALSSPEAKVGEPIAVYATVARTFLDGSRVALAVDGAPVAFTWAWARGDDTTVVSFDTRIDEPGRHEIRVGKKRADLLVE